MSIFISYECIDTEAFHWILSTNKIIKTKINCARSWYFISISYETNSYIKKIDHSTQYYSQSIINLQLINHSVRTIRFELYSIYYIYSMEFHGCSAILNICYVTVQFYIYIVYRSYIVALLNITNLLILLYINCS